MNKRNASRPEIDFETFGITIKGELLRRASAVLSRLPEWNDREFASQLADDILMSRSYDLVRNYVKCQLVVCGRYDEQTPAWVVRRLAWTLMNACLKYSLPAALKMNDRIEDAAESSELHSVALAIIREYKSYRANEEKIQKHKTAQERIITKKRKEFLTTLKKRDGSFCRSCRSESGLTIDHEDPLILGGFSVLDNLQLLCGFCNTRKNNRPMEYLLSKTTRPIMLDKAN